MIQKWMESLEIKDQDEQRRRIRFVATSFLIDRDGDMIHIVPTKKGQGLVIARGDKTPLKTFHDYHSWPVGFARDWELSSRKAIYTGEFFTKEINPEAELAYQMAKTGVMSNSIGFLDKMSERRDLTDEEKKLEAAGGRVRQGVEIFEAELLEVSLTDVPSNPGAIALTRETEDVIRKCLTDIIRQGGGCARKGCSTLPLEQRIKDLELEIIKEMNSGEAKVSRDSLQSLQGHLKDLDYMLWAKTGSIDTVDLLASMAKDMNDLADKMNPETKPGYEETDEFIHYRVRDPDDFEKDSIRQMTLKKDKPRVFGRIGHLKGETKTTLQALLFPKEDEWDIPKARAWVKDHPDIGKDISAELLQTVVEEV